ncbi:MAG: glutamine synthetase family protein [Candidatus Thermoplasmatota archaeon]|nr:glutamine synthetase family protein [Candidatus Thermoplasmatota archaeon]
MELSDKRFGFSGLREVKEMLRGNPDVRFIRFITADMNGERPCNFTIPISELSRTGEDTGAESSGEERGTEKGFDASSLYPERINESDKNAHLDYSTARILPWRYGTRIQGFERSWREMVVFGDIMDPINGPYKFDSRMILKRVLGKVRELGIADTVYIGPEMEFFLFDSDESGFPIIEEISLDDSTYLRPRTVDFGAYFKGGLYGEVRKEAQMVMEEMGYAFEYDHHEVSNSQHEIDVHYMPALEMADFVMLFRYVVKKVASARGLFASFMPKPIAGVNGSGMHTHQSLFKDGMNVFYDSKSKDHLSMECKRYIAGLMKYVPEIAAVLNPWVNSFKRLVPGFEAPAYICFDLQNRSSLIRIPGYDLDNPNAVRVELRNPDPSCNPYLSFALQIAAGVQGIVESLEPPLMTEVNVFELSDAEKDDLGIRRLPPDLSSALDLLEGSALARDVMGEEFLSHYLKAKRSHVDSYLGSLGHRARDESMRIRISRFEIENLLPVL